MKVICISGKARHGKDTVAGFLKEAFELRRKKVLVVHYGDLLKYVCKTFFSWDGEKDEAGRTLLQYIGTDRLRAAQPDFWVSFVANILTIFKDKWDYVLIPDTRFPNEYEFLKARGFDTILMRIVRQNFVSPLTNEQQNHPSETALDGYPYDIVVNNEKDLDTLKMTMRVFALFFMEQEEKYEKSDDSI